MVGCGRRRRGAFTRATRASMASVSGEWPVSYLTTREYCGVILQMHCSPSQLVNIKSLKILLYTVYHEHSRPSCSATRISAARAKCLGCCITSGGGRSGDDC